MSVQLYHNGVDLGGLNELWIRWRSRSTHATKQF